MIILESTKVIVESLPKESIWSSSLVTSIIGSIVGGIAAFIGIIWQMKKQQKLEIKKKKVEIQIDNLDKCCISLNEILKKIDSSIKILFDHPRKQLQITDEIDISAESLNISLPEIKEHILLLKGSLNYIFFDELIITYDNLLTELDKKIKVSEDNEYFIPFIYTENKIKEFQKLCKEFLYIRVNQEKLRLLDSIGK